MGIMNTPLHPQNNFAENNFARNNFDFLRFLAASLVIFSHCYPLTNRPEPLVEWTQYGNLGDLAVRIFFIISGYLVTASMLRSRSVIHYFWKRAMRIFPAFGVSILVCGLVIGPLMTTLPLNEYFTDPLFRHFLRNINLYVVSYILPGVFADHPTPSANGSYWTLCIEFTCYLVIAALALVKQLRPFGIAVLAAVFFAWHQHLFGGKDKYYFHMSRFFLFLYGGQFLAGSWLYFMRDRLPMDWRIAALVLAVVCGCLLTNSGNLVLTLALPYLVVWFALTPLPVLQDWGRFGDFSYGIYLYGFPMQQLVIAWLGAGVGIAVLFPLAWTAALGCAVLSWHLVEARMIRQKAVFGRK